MSTPLAQHRRADSERRRTAVRATLAQMTRAGELISVSAVARRAGVHRSLIYRHPDLQAEIDTAAQHTPEPQRTDQITTASLRVSIENERARNRRLTARLERLEHRLSEALGRETLHDSGLGIDDDKINQTEQRLAELEHENADLRRQINDTRVELEAAQHVNQMLTRELNRDA